MHQRNLFFFLAVSLLGLLMVSSAFNITMHVNATCEQNCPQWIGNDDGEFGNPSCISCSPASATMATEATLSSSISYNTNDGPYISLQYNPDLVASEDYQTTTDCSGARCWFQTGILAFSNNALFTIQVYSTTGGCNGNPCWQWFSNNEQFTNVNNVLSANAFWWIYEPTNGNGYVNQVDFIVDGGGSNGGDYSIDENIPANWLWLRSNICWCGTGTQVADFTSGSGSIGDWRDSSSYNYGQIGPPIYIATGESSNMGYGCFSLQGSGNNEYLLQSFQLNSHC